MEKVISIEPVLNNLSSLIEMGNILEEQISEKLFQDIETMILNQQKQYFPSMEWKTIIWDVCANFEYKELWFAPIQWIHCDSGHELSFDIADSYAFFKLTHYEKGSYDNIDDDFSVNNNRFPTANFFRHEEGCITLQFFLNVNLIRELSYKRKDLIKEVAETQNYEERRQWIEFRQDTLTLCQNLEKLGFKLDESCAFLWLKIDTIDSDLMIQEYHHGSLKKALAPIQYGLNKINENFNIFDEMQEKAKKYYLGIAER